jgi:hypothetical protein
MAIAYFHSLEQADTLEVIFSKPDGGEAGCACSSIRVLRAKAASFYQTTQAISNMRPRRIRRFKELSRAAKNAAS